MLCAKCQQENPAGARFCGECGARHTPTCPGCETPHGPDQNFCWECGTRLAATPPAPRSSHIPRHLAERILTSKAALEGERKQVTILFADLKGSTELLVDRDPEESRKLLDPVLDRMMEAVHYYEGTVNQVMGDGIMALFGAPLAHEDHAVRGCYAALRMQESVKRYAEEVFKSARSADPHPRRAQLRRSGRAVHRQRPAHGLHGGGPDDPPRGTDGADRPCRTRSSSPGPC